MDGTVGSSRDSGVRAVVEVLAVTVFAFLVALIAGVAFLVPLVAIGYGITTTLVLLGSTAAGQLGMFAAGYGYLRYRDLSVSISPLTRSAVVYVAAGIPVALVGAIALSALLAALDLVSDSVIGETAAADPTFLLGLAALSVLVVAPVEEFVFRGVIQGRLRTRFGPVPAIVGASLLFGSLHLTNYSGNLRAVVAGALMIGAIGAIFGALYERTDNLAVPIAVHAGYNVVLLLISYAAATAG